MLRVRGGIRGGRGRAASVDDGEGSSDYGGRGRGRAASGGDGEGSRAFGCGRGPARGRVSGRRSEEGDGEGDDIRIVGAGRARGSPTGIRRGRGRPQGGRQGQRYRLHIIGPDRGPDAKKNEEFRFRSEIRLPRHDTRVSKRDSRLWLGKFSTREQALRAHDFGAFYLFRERARLKCPGTPPPIDDYLGADFPRKTIAELSNAEKKQIRRLARTFAEQVAPTGANPGSSAEDDDAAEEHDAGGDDVAEEQEARGGAAGESGSARSRQSRETESDSCYVPGESGSTSESDGKELLSNVYRSLGVSADGSFKRRGRAPRPSSRVASVRRDPTSSPQLQRHPTPTDERALNRFEPDKENEKTTRQPEHYADSDENLPFSRPHDSKRRRDQDAQLSSKSHLILEEPEGSIKADEKSSDAGIYDELLPLAGFDYTVFGAHEQPVSFAHKLVSSDEGRYDASTVNATSTREDRSRSINESREAQLALARRDERKVGEGRHASQAAGAVSLQPGFGNLLVTGEASSSAAMERLGAGGAVYRLESPYGGHQIASSSSIPAVAAVGDDELRPASGRRSRNRAATSSSQFQNYQQHEPPQQGNSVIADHQASAISSRPLNSQQPGIPRAQNHSLGAASSSQVQNYQEPAPPQLWNRNQRHNQAVTSSSQADDYQQPRPPPVSNLNQAHNQAAALTSQHQDYRQRRPSPFSSYTQARSQAAASSPQAQNYPQRGSPQLWLDHDQAHNAAAASRSRSEIYQRHRPPQLSNLYNQSHYQGAASSSQAQHYQQRRPPQLWNRNPVHNLAATPSSQAQDYQQRRLPQRRNDDESRNQPATSSSQAQDYVQQRRSPEPLYDDQAHNQAAISVRAQDYQQRRPQLWSGDQACSQAATSISWQAPDYQQRRPPGLRSDDQVHDIAAASGSQPGNEAEMRQDVAGGGSEAQLCSSDQAGRRTEMLDVNRTGTDLKWWHRSSEPFRAFSGLRSHAHPEDQDWPEYDGFDLHKYFIDPPSGGL